MAHGASRVDDAVARLMGRIGAGEFDGSPLPREEDLAAQTKVSRTTLREAVKVLKTQGVLRVEQGRGTFVNPTTQWRAVEAMAGMGRHGDAGRQAVSMQLLQVRRMIEMGAIELFVGRCTPQDVADLEATLLRMESSQDAGDVAGFVAADMAFHDVILQRCGNAFVPTVCLPISEALWEGRHETSAHDDVRRHALVQHRAILDAVRSGSVTDAVRAMADHLQQTSDDLQSYVLRERGGVL